MQQLHLKLLNSWIGFYYKRGRFQSRCNVSPISMLQWHAVVFVNKRNHIQQHLNGRKFEGTLSLASYNYLQKGN